MSKNYKGFSLFEVLISMGILALFLSVLINTQLVVFQKIYRIHQIILKHYSLNHLDNLHENP